MTTAIYIAMFLAGLGTGTFGACMLFMWAMRPHMKQNAANATKSNELHEQIMEAWQHRNNLHARECEAVEGILNYFNSK